MIISNEAEHALSLASDPEHTGEATVVNPARALQR